MIFQLRIILQFILASADCNIINYKNDNHASSKNRPLPPDWHTYLSFSFINDICLILGMNKFKIHLNFFDIKNHGNETSIRRIKNHMKQ